jgi:transcriptional regulator with XRE-family HTH domain
MSRCGEAGADEALLERGRSLMEETTFRRASGGGDDIWRPDGSILDAVLPTPIDPTSHLRDRSAPGNENDTVDHMSYSALRQALRSARRERGMTQASLAARSGVSRVTIARLEAGSGDVRLGSLDALCGALDFEIAIGPAGSGPALETRLAREREKCRRLDLRRRHAVLAARLLSGPPKQAAALVARARVAVDRWERQGLCSRHYVSRWRELLGGPVPRVARALLEPGDWEDALFQNTPWAFALESAAV